jgi:anaerobic selenocysteine-containing dehydrogenase
MQAAERGDIDAALLLGGNLFSANPDSSWAKRALDAIGFKLYLTTTLNRGHVHGIDSGAALILPVAARDEETQPTTQESMFNYVRLSDGGIERLDNVKPESWILAELAERLLPDSPVNFAEFKSHRELRQIIARTVPGMEALASIDVAREEFHISSRVMHTPHFNTPDQRARFCNNRWAASSDSAEFPFTLSTIRSEGQFNTIVYEDEDSYRNASHRWSVLMNQQDIRDLGLSIGGRATLRSAQGVMTGVEVVLHDLPRGNAMAYFPEANVLTSTAVDARSKTPAFKSTPIAIEPLLAVTG